MIEEKGSVSKIHKSCGIYRFQVEGYSGLSTRTGDSTESPEFNLCGYTWQLRIFPGGSLDAHKGYLSYYLASKSNRMARASYTLSVVNQLIGGEDECFSSSGVRIFEAKGVQVDGWGRDKFMAASMLKDATLGFRVNDTVIFKVEITVYGELEDSPVVDNADSGRWLYQNRLEDCLRGMFNNVETSDVVLVVGTARERFYVHKALLACRSDVFKSMFFSDFKESRGREVCIPDVEPAVMRALLFYIYTDLLPDKVFLADHSSVLLLAALKYQLPVLLECAETALVGQLAPEGAPGLLAFSDNICCPTLKKKVLLYIAHNANRIVQIREFQELDGSLLSEANTMIDFVAKKRGCRGSLDKERKISIGCIIT